MSETLVGIMLILLAAFFQGTYALFLKFTHQWKWENFWAVFSLVSLVVSPALCCYVLVPNFGGILASSPLDAIIYSFIAGMFWGIGSVLFGLSIIRIGLALTYSLIIGLTATIGSFVPLLLTDSLSLNVLLIFTVGIFFMILGLAFSAYAGMKRENLRKSNNFRIGLFLAIISGLTSPMLNLGFIYGNPILETAKTMGISKDFASIPIWITVLLGGFVVNFGYATYLLVNTKTYRLFPKKVGNYLALSVTSGIFFFSGLAIYGVASTVLETLGTSIGWALLMSLMILISNFSSIFMGEWTDSKKASRFQLISISLLTLGISIIGSSFYF